MRESIRGKGAKGWLYKGFRLAYKTFDGLKTVDFPSLSSSLLNTSLGKPDLGWIRENRVFQHISWLSDTLGVDG
jgi:hypothetical protein